MSVILIQRQFQLHCGEAVYQEWPMQIILFFLPGIQPVLPKIRFIMPHSSFELALFETKQPPHKKSTLDKFQNNHKTILLQPVGTEGHLSSVEADFRVHSASQPPQPQAFITSINRASRKVSKCHLVPLSKAILCYTRGHSRPQL